MGKNGVDWGSNLESLLSCLTLRHFHGPGNNKGISIVLES